MTTEQTKLTKREVVAFLRECGFDPKETGPRLNVAARTDKDYCLNRAIEEISGKPKKANIFFINLQFF